MDNGGMSKEYDINMLRRHADDENQELISLKKEYKILVDKYNDIYIKLLRAYNRIDSIVELLENKDFKPPYNELPKVVILNYREEI